MRLAYRLRGVLVAPPILFSAIVSWHEYDNGSIVWPLGVPLFLAGWTIRMWAQRHVGYRLKVRKAITCCGPYAYVRNPIYLANILMGLGAVAASKVLWMLPLTLLWYVAVYSLVIRHEEHRLAHQYADAYAAYRARVHRWLPRFPARGAGPCPHRAVARVLLVELHTPLIMAPAALKAAHGLMPAILRAFRFA